MPTRIRIVTITLLAAICLVAIPERAQALAAGTYYLGKSGGKWVLIDLTGKEIWGTTCTAPFTDCSDG